MDEFYKISKADLLTIYEIFGRIKGQKVIENEYVEVNFSPQPNILELNIDNLTLRKSKSTLKQKECEKMYYLKKGKGTWHNRSDGRYEIRFTHNKKRISVIDKNKDNCFKKYQQKLKLCEKNNTAAIPFIKKNYTLFTWLDTWLDEYKQGKITDGWYKTIKSCIKNQIKICFADRQLNELNILEIEQSIKAIKSSRMRETACNVLNMALNTAYKKQLMKNDVMRYVETYKHKRENGNAFTEQQQAEILNYAKSNSKYYHYFLFYFYTGCRPKEIYQIKYCDLNFEKRIVFIDGTKTHTSKRTIPMFTPLLVLQNDKYKPTDNLFKSTQKTLREELKRILKAKEINENQFTLKSMRHSFATRLFEKGINDKIRSAWLGHSSTNMTNNVYTHILNDIEQQQALKIDPNFDPTN